MGTGVLQPRPDPGRGVFETILVVDGVARFAAAHLRRLESSLGALYGLALPPGLSAELAERAAALPGRGRLRIDATAAAGTVSVALATSALAAGRPPPVPCRVVSLPGGLGAHKWADRRQLEGLTAPGVTALLTDNDGELLEAAWGNLWLREDNRLITPPADGRLLPGVTRGRLLALADGLGFATCEETVTGARLRAASEVFLTSALRLAVPAVLDGVAAASPELDRIRAALDRAWAALPGTD